MDDDTGLTTVGSPPLSPRVARRPRGSKPLPPPKPSSETLPRRRVPRSSRATNGTTPPKVQPPHQPEEDEEEQNDEEVLAETLATSEIVQVRSDVADLLYLIVGLFGTIVLVATFLVEMQQPGNSFEMAFLCCVAAVAAVAWCEVLRTSDREHSAWNLIIALAGLACLISVVVVLVVETLLNQWWQSDEGTVLHNISAVVKNVTDLASKK